MTHTPGPWRVDADYTQNRAKYDLFNKPRWIGVYSDHPDYEVAQTLGYYNARLIAAAPDLLEALEAVFEKHAKPVFMGNPYTLEPEWDKARAAIAKAKE